MVTIDPIMLAVFMLIVMTPCSVLAPVLATDVSYASKIIIRLAFKTMPKC
jgi:hypothetical protein